MKKKNIIGTGLFAALSLASLVSCSLEIPTSPSGDEETTVTAEESTNIQAATSMNILSNLLGRNASPVMRQFSKDHNVEITDEEKSKIEELLPTVDMLLDNGNVFYSTLEVVDTAIDEITYSYKETISFVNSTYENETYVLIYNKFDKEGNVILPSIEVDEGEVAEDEVADEVEDDENDDVVDEVEDENEGVQEGEGEEKWNHDDHDHNHNEHDDYPDNHDKNEVKTYKIIGGLATFDEENYYTFESISKSEIDDDETEEERWFRIDLGEKSYIKVNQEIESETKKFENEFSYVLVQDGKVTSKYSIEIEKGRKDEISVKFDEYSYKIDRFEDTDGVVYYKIKYRDDSSKIIATYKKEVDDEGNIVFTLVK